MIDSMTKEERNLEKSIDDSRMRRILRGSGCMYEHFAFMQQNFKQIKKMIGRFSKMNIGNDNIAEMMRNPKLLQQKLGGALDPRTLQQMGGMDNIMSMMKQLGGMEK